MSLRDELVQAVNGNPISADDAWAIIHRWDHLEAALDAARRYRKTGSLTAEIDLHDALKAVDGLADSNWCKRR